MANKQRQRKQKKAKHQRIKTQTVKVKEYKAEAAKAGGRDISGENHTVCSNRRLETHNWEEMYTGLEAQLQTLSHQCERTTKYLCQEENSSKLLRS